MTLPTRLAAPSFNGLHGSSDDFLASEQLEELPFVFMCKLNNRCDIPLVSDLETIFISFF